MPGCRQLHPFRATQQQCAAEVVFEIRHALADRRGDGMRALGGTGDAARIGHGYEQFQVT
jgi:hypothetical protein